MEDTQIIALYWGREEDAIVQTEQKYGAYCRTIAENILVCPQDSEECVSDTWLAAWNAIPPQRPRLLSAFLGRITRNLALSRLRKKNALRRGGGQPPLALEELDECVSGGLDVERQLEAKELGQAIDRFLAALPRQEREIFVCRYFYLASLTEIGLRTGLRQSQLKNRLFRTRQKLKNYLKEEELC